MKRNTWLYVVLVVLIVVAVVVWVKWGPTGGTPKHSVESTLDEIKPREDAPEVPYGGTVEGVPPPIAMGGDSK
jgi:hypothetical protein